LYILKKLVYKGMTPDINMGKHGTSNEEVDDFLTKDTIRRMRSTSICNERDIIETPVARETQGEGEEEGEEEEEQKQHHQRHETNCTSSNTTKKKKRRKKKGNKRGGNHKGCSGNSNSRRRQGSYRIEHSDDDDDDDDDRIPEKGVSSASSTSHKNNDSSSTRRRSILKAPSHVARIDANHNNGDVSKNENGSVNALRFGKEVYVREYKRGIGSDAVPTGSGGWPLGLSNELCREVTVPLLLDDVMIIRPSNLSDPYPNSDKSESIDWNRDISTSVTNKARPMSETDRMRIILPVLDSNYHFKTTDPTDDKQSSAHSSSHHHHHHHSKRKTRSSSSSSSCGYHNPEIEHLGHEIRHELEVLRNNRSITGCECRKLKNISGRRGMNERKLREELRKRKLLTPEEARSKHSSPSKKEELAKRLQQAVDENGCCGEDCPCYKSGIGCHAESCSCWHLSHCVDKKHKTKSSAMEGEQDDDADVCSITKRCGNKNGIYATDYKAIEAVRAKFLK